ncbi:AlpA family phage regulatory protein [Shewanella sp. D64]|uniref:helix-turn-helix transcriptional regulator n=1 Tax=unclassified Shewanella TaxID=196818 RepID=UPI0022BA65E7|nr:MULTISPECIES: helix-turn-helix domain-containing protein [unclassified Shewanella]MEC4724292.1 AlpA family phage regulatory protein [Shewanella sp. D64]MEC4738804.1 AlpA family phage regulatory protein [Shewanella sp. E94]WBJ97757.1 AlpA family phage regulatory protein [Shewanella sp. MTB7]
MFDKELKAHKEKGSSTQEYFNKTQLARVLGISRSTVYRLAEKPGFPETTTEPFPGRYRLSEVISWVEQETQTF